MTGKHLTDADRLLRSITEAQWQEQVIEYAQVRGWLVFHARPALTQKGKWLTAVSADGAGFVDLVMARDGQVVFAELKRMTGKLTDAQQVWIAALPNAHVWRPSDWDTVEAILR